ncbi:MAG: PAS domain S-box protein [Deltaproteobacteria bacterium]|nr:PAS domain S-box protein [Deltaproteobacteria bacterium]
MLENSITGKQLEQELAEMRASLRDLEKCRKALRKSKEEYERLFETAPDAMVFVNRGGTIVLVNAQLEEMFGFPAGELAGQDLEALIPVRFREKHRNLLDRYFTNPQARPMGLIYEIYGLRKDGSEIPVDISLSSLKMDGELVAAASVRDITERKQTEEKLEHNYHIQRVTSSVLKIALEPLSLDEQLDRILDLTLTIPHLSLQAKGGICLVEEGSGDLVMRAVRGFAPADRPPCLRISLGQSKCLCGKAVLTGQVVFSNCREEGHEGNDALPFPHGHYCIPIIAGAATLGLVNVFVKEGHKRKESEEEFLVAIANTLAGIIERHKATEERARLQEQLVQKEKLAALGRLTANVAHEIRNPLTAVGGFARRLHKNVQAASKEKEYADIIVSEVARLEKILSNVLVISEGVPLAPDYHDIHVLLDEVLQSYEVLCAERAITVTKSYGLAAPHVFVDRGHVREVIMNVVGNGIDAMPGGGALYVGTADETVDGRSFVAVTIEDSGEGIPEEQLKMIFEPFFTTKGPRKGTGLGLALVKKVLEDHGGSVRVKSRVGGGTRLDLLFPAPVKRLQEK